MFTETRTVIFARAKSNGEELERDYWAHRNGFTERGEAFSAEAPAYGQVEIVEATTTTTYRSNKTLAPGTEPIKEEKVLATLNSAEATHLMGTMARALAHSLDTGPKTEVGRVEEHEVLS